MIYTCDIVNIEILTGGFVRVSAYSASGGPVVALYVLNPFRLVASCEKHETHEEAAACISARGTVASHLA